MKNLKLINKFSDFFLPGKFELIFGGSETGPYERTSKKNFKKIVKLQAFLQKTYMMKLHSITFFSELIITKDLEARNSVFVEKSDVFVALPGGIGTLHEIITILNQNNILKEINKKIFLVNDTFFWEPLNYLLQKLIDEKFLSKVLDNFKICNLSELMKELENLNAKKIKVKNPIVDICGDEMANIIWDKIKTNLINPFLEIKLVKFDLSIKNRDLTNDKTTHEAAQAIKKIQTGVKCATITQMIKEFLNLI